MRFPCVLPASAPRNAQRMFALLLCLFALQASAQHEPCGAELPPELQPWYRARTELVQQKANAHKPAQVLYVPLHIHLVGSSAGAGYFRKADAYEIVCGLNQRYAPLDMRFFLEDSITYINNDDYVNPSLPYINQMMNLHNIPQACNIYLVPGLTGLCGLAYAPASGPAMGRGGIVLKNNCALPGNSDPTHEMGHYFSLVHTFQDWDNSNAEFVDESNCATAGDLLCDTRADYRDFRWNCPYPATINDPQGDPYDPDSSLYMGYANTPCPSRFSPAQQAAIRYSRENDRHYLDSISVPSFNALAAVQLMVPAQGAADVPSDNNAVFSWTSAPGALEYNLRIKLATSASFQTGSVVNVMTSDTFFLVNGLLATKTYDWEVLPVNLTDACIACDSAGPEVRSFSVVYANAIGDLGGNVASFALFPNPARLAEDVQVSLVLAQPEALRIAVHDATGRQIFLKETRLTQGKNELHIPAVNLPAGVYQLSIRGTGIRLARTFVKTDF